MKYRYKTVEDILDKNINWKEVEKSKSELPILTFSPNDIEDEYIDEFYTLLDNFNYGQYRECGELFIELYSGDYDWFSPLREIYDKFGYAVVETKPIEDIIEDENRMDEMCIIEV